MSKRELKTLLTGSKDVPTRKSRLHRSNQGLTMNEGTQVEAETGLEELRSELTSQWWETEAKDVELDCLKSELSQIKAEDEVEATRTIGGLFPGLQEWPIPSMP